VTLNGDRRAFLRAVARRAAGIGALLAGAGLGRRAGARQRGVSAAERLVADLQDGGKTIFLRYPPPAGIDQTRDLGRALYALRVPLNDIVASPVPQARRTAEAAFGTERLRTASELGGGETSDAALQALRELLRTIPGPGMNRVLVGDRPALERAAERRFTDAVLPEGAMAVFLPGQLPQLLGTITAARVIASATARGAL